MHPNPRDRQGHDPTSTFKPAGGANIGFYILTVYTASFFLGLPGRLSFLATVRFDFVLGIFLLYLSLLYYWKQKKASGAETNTSRLLVAIFFYIILTIPLAEWPGSVIKQGLPQFFKAIVFYIFVVCFVNDRALLKKYVLLCLILLIVIIIEPLYFYFTTGRLGYVDYSMGTVPFYRLTGMTSQVGGNPNGLANVVAITVPFLAFFFKYYKNNTVKIAILACFPLLFITLVLTGSRSGFIATMVAVLVCVLKYKSKMFSVVLIIIFAGILFFKADGVYKERYLSMVETDVAGRESAVGRIVHIENALEIFSKKPLFGYGIGTYKEANWNLMQEGLVSHNLYTGVLVELGVFGFAIFATFIVSLFTNIHKIKNTFENAAERDPYAMVLVNIIETVLISELVFSIFAGTLSYYIWYLFGGLSVILLRLHHDNKGLDVVCHQRRRLSGRR